MTSSLLTPPRLCPVTLRQANAFVLAHHRHSDPTRGHKFSIGCRADGHLVGVAICGRPVARPLDDGFTLEILRVCTDGTRNACTMLYGACRRAGRAMGYQLIITYTLATEPGSSLRAAGARAVARVRPKAWDCPSRPRESRAVEAEEKIRWEL